MAITLFPLRNTILKGGNIQRAERYLAEVIYSRDVLITSCLLMKPRSALANAIAVAAAYGYYICSYVNLRNYKSL
jgi:hypothetical protein